MSRVNSRIINTDSKSKYLNLLWDSIAKLKNREEVEQFFKDLLSESESIMISRRIEIDRRLLKGESYSKITSELKVGMDTIGRVQQWLSSGFGGYEKAIDNLEKKLGRSSEKLSILKEEVYSFGWLKKKYPIHFLLFNLISEKDFKRKKSK